MTVSLKELLSNVVETMGYEFVGCEMHGQGRNTVLRLYIDSKTGVTVDDCSRVSRQVSAMLDVEDPIQGHYTLEVSSPGLDRPLFEIAHYQKVIGSRVKVRLSAPINDRRNFVGVLQRVENDNIYLHLEEGEVALPFSNIEKAKVIADLAD